MGHIRLGILPKYPRWTAIMALLNDSGVSEIELADQVIKSSGDGLVSESAQASVGYCVWLLAQLALSARADDFESRLVNLGLSISANTSALAFLAQISRLASNYLAGVSPHTAFNNIAGLALREALARTIGVVTPSLFGSGLTEVQQSLYKFSTRRQFSNLLHIYLASFLNRTLNFVVAKEIANHIGPDQRFGSVHELGEFEDTLENFANQTARIVDDFAAGWYSKTVWQHGDVSESEARQFSYVALRKLRSDVDISGVQ